VTDEAVPRLRVQGLSKSFGGAQALDRANLTVLPGEVHGLLGANGSGKSTLIKVLSGYHAPDAGTLEIDGRSVLLPIPLGRSEMHGLAFVHQNLGLLPEATVLENLIAGDHERLNPWWISWSGEAARARELFDAQHLDIGPWQQVEDLSPVQRAQLAIVRAADRVQEHRQHGSLGVLVLDEPTPFLPYEDVRALFALLRRLTASGVSIIFVSHDIDEILEVTDRSTVLRDGKVVGSFDTRTTARGELVEAIVGRALRVERRVRPLSPAKPVASVQGLTGQIVKDIEFSVRPGEILGLTGLIGSGYDEVPMLLSGARKATSGRIAIAGKSHEVTDISPAVAIANRIALIPADRQKAGIAPNLSLTENAMLPVIGGSLALNHRKLRAKTQEIMQRFSVKATSPDQAASELSGGNQQKLVLGKWLHCDPLLLLLDEPTQGIDVGARQEIYNRIEEMCAAQGAVICATSEFEQLEIIAHRVLVFDRGRIKAELKGDDVTKSAIAEACYQAQVHHAAG
jgi:ribose transport system ATP-binding protein